MDKAKDLSTIRKGISISLVITILFTCGFILGALTKAVEAMNVESVPETTVVTTQAPTTVAPETTTAVPTTAAPETTTSVAESTTTTTQPSVTDDTTTAPSEEVEEESCTIVSIFVSILEFFKQIIDFIISALQSL